MTEAEQFPELNINELQVKTSYDIQTPEYIVNSLTSFDNQQTNTAATKVPVFATAIAGLQQLIENGLYRIENFVNEESVSIRTLPHHAENDHQLSSVIQPTAWILSGPGCYYDPDEDRIMKNLVNHWDGKTNSIFRHIGHSVTNSCFITYHIITLLAIICSIAMYVFGNRSNYVSPETGETIVTGRIQFQLIFFVSVGYDLIAMLFIIIMETFFPGEGNPWLAHNVQKQIEATMNQIMDDIVYNIPSKDLLGICENVQKSNSEITGIFIMRYFYEPTVTLLMQQLKSQSSALFNPKNGSTIQWDMMEHCLTLYRFAREISLSVHLGTNDFKIDSQQQLNMRKLLVTAIEEGQPDVHIQLLRLLYNSSLNIEERKDVIKQNTHNLCLTHFIGADDVEAIITVLKRDVEKPKTAAQKRDPTVDQRRINIKRVLEVNNRTLVYAVSTMINSRSKNLPAPSEFNA